MKKDFTMFIKYDRNLIDNKVRPVDQLNTKEILEEVYNSLE